MAAISGEASEEAEETDLNDDPTLPPSIGSTTTTSSDEILSARLLPKPVKDELPMYSVQKDGFRQMLKTFDNRYEIPDQSYFSRTAVPELYAITRRRVAEQVAADCSTRWGSTQKMIERILEQEKAIRVVLGSDRKVSNLVLSWQDLDVLTAINAALSPLAEFTDVMSGS
uniref:Uncharacterized protein n=1 Tax=Amphimedon queenslandica TaxID=400682 RepID=A0A1X7TA28_AMPQE